MTKHGGIETGDLVMNNHKGHIRYGTIIDKRIDEEGWAQFAINWHADEVHEKIVKWNVDLGSDRNRFDPKEYRTDTLHAVDAKHLERVLKEHSAV